MSNYLSTLSQSLSGDNFSLIMLLASFLGGLIASISPCSLSMLPIIIGYVGGYSNEGPLKILVQMAFFVLGTSIVFSAIGVVCAITGKVFIAIAPSYFIILMGAVLLIMGLKLIGLLDFNLPLIIIEIPQGSGKNTFLYPLLIGAVFALAGTPCSTPILAGIMAFATMSSHLLYAVLMLFLFSLGQGLILIIAGVFTSSIKKFKSLANYSELLLKISGFLLVMASIYIFYKIFSPLL